MTGMLYPSERQADEIETAVHTYGNLLFRICLVMLGNESDAEDAVQETMINYLQKAPSFESAEHEKAWLITVATHKCRDMQRFRLRHPQIDIDSLQEHSCDKDSSGVIEALMALPEKYRIVLTLYYVEEYKVKDISAMIGKTPSAVKMRLQKGRKLLEEKYRKEFS